MDDESARRHIRSTLDESLLVEAAAGTGKTTELIARVVALLGQGKAKIPQVVAVTFTRKAAGELKLRLRQALDRACAASEDDAERINLERAIAHLEEARIGTIHSFCAEILRERPVEAGIDPDFQEVADDESPRIYNRAFQHWIQERLDTMPDGLRRALSRLSTRPSYRETPLDQLRDAGARLIEWRDFPTPWRRDPFDRAEAIDRLVVTVLTIAQHTAAANPSDHLRKALLPVEALATWIERAEAPIKDGERVARDYDGLEARLSDLRTTLNNDKRKGYGRAFAPDVSRDEVIELRKRLLTDLDRFMTDADADLAALLREELSEVTTRYEELKRRMGKLDFLDLLVCARDLVRDNPDVRKHLQRQITHIFVDEFQDTDPLQAEILLLLAADDPTVRDWREARPVAGKLFLVGDPKQSIYRFRRADLLLYQEIKDQLTAKGVRLLHLRRSFRSLRSLQQAINASFAPEMTGDRVHGQADYVPLEPYAEAEDEQPTLVALPAPRPYSKYRPKVTSWAIDECLPGVVTAYVEWLIKHSGWKVRDPDPAPDGDARVPIEAKHICILFRRFMSWNQDVTRDYVRGLEARGIPHLLVGARSFHRREEVETLRAAMTAIEWPDDELAVFATLKGSLFAIPDSVLLRFHAHFPRGLHPYHPLPDDLDGDFAPIAEALAELAHLHRRRNWVPIVDTIHALLDFTRAHAGFAFRPAGDQVLANVQRVADLARSYELGGGTSFRGFVDRLAAEAEKSTSSESPMPDEGAEGVRIMTVHAAKGLEFPIVILADLSCRLAAESADRFIDASRGLCAIRLLRCSPADLRDNEELERKRDAAEGVRIAYVAATRARDLLVVPTVGDEAQDGWLGALNKAVYPPRELIRQSTKAPLCPELGESSVLARHFDLDHGPDFSVRPGLHKPQVGDHRVVWWDPGKLDVDAARNFGLRAEQILADDDGDASQESERCYDEWRTERARVLRKAGLPTIDVVIATEAEDGPPGERPRIIVEEIEIAKGRPRGKRFGTLVHALLRAVPLDADTDTIARLAALHRRVIDATKKEASAAIEAVARALAHPLFEQARRSERCLRESPIVLDLEDDRILEGTIDLAFLIDGAWTVIDFKTDGDLKTLRESYEKQVAWYVYALREMTGNPTRGAILRV